MKKPNKKTVSRFTQQTCATILAIALGTTSTPAIALADAETQNNNNSSSQVQENTKILTYTTLAHKDSDWNEKSFEKIQYANKFHIEDDSKITELAVFIPDTNTKTEITLYKTTKDATAPEESKSITTKTKTFETKGIQKFEFTDPIEVKKDDYIFAVVTLSQVENEINAYFVNTPRAVKENNSDEPIKKNESFIKFNNTWSDFSDWLKTNDGKPVTQEFSTNPEQTTNYNVDNFDISLKIELIEPEPTVYTISFDKNADDATGNMQSIEVEETQSKKIDSCAFTREGYTFTNWNTEKDGSGTPYVDEATITPEDNMTLYAQWKAQEYTVKFVNDDGTELQNSQVAYGETPTYTGATPTKSATSKYTYTFKGWSPEIVAATKDTTYTATYTETAIPEPTPTPTPTPTPNNNTNNNSNNSNNNKTNTNTNTNRTSTNTNNNRSTTISTPAPTMSTDVGEQLTSRSKDITYTINQSIPADVTSFTISTELDKVMEFVSKENEVTVTCTGPYRATNTRIDGQKLTVDFEKTNNNTSSSGTARISYKAHIKPSADLTDYVYDQSKWLAKVPYKCQTIFKGSTTRQASSTEEVVKFSLGNKDNVKSATSTTTAAKKTSSEPLSKTADPTNITSIAALIPLGIASFIAGIKKRKN